MTNIPIIPIVPNGGAPLDDDTADLDDGETRDSQTRDGETRDSQATVEKDVREADAVNQKLDE